MYVHNTFYTLTYVYKNETDKSIIPLDIQQVNPGTLRRSRYRLRLGHILLATQGR